MKTDLSPDQIYQSAISEMKLAVSPAVYETLCKKTRLLNFEQFYDQFHFIIEIDSRMARDQIHLRDEQGIQRAIINIGGLPSARLSFVVKGEPIDIPAADLFPDQFANLNEATTLEQLEPQYIEAVYTSLKNELIQPDKTAYLSRYLWNRWGKILGNDRIAVILAMRQYCYWHSDNDNRDECQMTQFAIARDSHLSIQAVRRIFAAWRQSPEPPDSKCDPLRYFIAQAESQFKNEQGRGGIVREGNRYRIRIDDPLTPDDERFCKELAAQADEGKRRQSIRAWRKRNDV